METKLGEILSVRINSQRTPTDEKYGSGVIYRTENCDYDLVFTAKHCICRKNSDDCEKSCDTCRNPDFAYRKIKIDNPSNESFPSKVKVLKVYNAEERDFSVIKVSKFILPNLRTPSFSDSSKFEDIYGWGFPSIDDFKNNSEYLFLEVSKRNTNNSQMSLQFRTCTISNLIENQRNISGFSGAGIFDVNDYLIGIYTDTKASDAGIGVIIDEHINSFLIKNQLESLKIENSLQLLRTQVNEEFIKCFTKLDVTLESVYKKCNVFCLNFDGQNFDYDGLVERLGENIKYFALSRKQILDYEQKDLNTRIVRESDSKFMSSQHKDRLSDLLLFSFLEADLKAPKLFSSIEYENAFNGIHIKISNKNTYSLIYCVGCMQKTLSKALENCFGLIDTNSVKIDSPKKLISNSLVNSSFNDDTYEFLKNIMLPSKGELGYEMSNSFGVFAGFNIDIKDIKNSKGYIKNTHDKIKKVINNTINSHIFDSFKSIDIDEINIYVLPFEDVENFSSDFFN